MENKALGSFLKKCLLFPLPVLVLGFLYLGVELFVLPIGFYNFRVWEALYVKEFTGVLPGFFYPNQHVSMVEEGDIAHGTAWATHRQAMWETDEFGYRNSGPLSAPNDIVLTGDSFAAGCSVSQEETLAEVLSRDLERNVYFYAPVFDPCPIDRFLREERFQKNRPKVLLLVCVERNIPNLAPIHTPGTGFPGTNSFWKRWVERSHGLERIIVLLDRASKVMAWNYLWARMEGPDLKRITGNSRDPDRIQFYFGDEVDRGISSRDLARFALTIRGYQETLERMGIHFVFCPVPNKESVYFEFLPSGKKNPFLERLKQELRTQKIDMVDLKTLFRERYRAKKIFLYRKDDGHWDPEGIRVAAGAIATELQKKHR